MDKPSEAAARAHVDAYLARWERFELSRTIVGKLYWDLIDVVLPAYAAERERAARREALEDACKAVCAGCQQGRDAIEIQCDWFHPAIDGPGKYYTPPMACAASAIRVLMSEGESEVVPCSNS